MDYASLAIKQKASIIKWSEQRVETVREKIKTVREKMKVVRDRYRPIIRFDYMSLPREKNGLCISSKKIEKGYDRIEWVKNGERERKDGDCDREEK